MRSFDFSNGFQKLNIKIPKGFKAVHTMFVNVINVKHRCLKKKIMNENNPPQINANGIPNTNPCGEFIQEFQITVNLNVKPPNPLQVWRRARYHLPLSNNIDKFEYREQGLHIS